MKRMLGAEWIKVRAAECRPIRQLQFNDEMKWTHAPFISCIKLIDSWRQASNQLTKTNQFIVCRVD